jgi:hypothetical protein
VKKHFPIVEPTPAAQRTTRRLCACGIADVFDPPIKHSEACRAKHDLADAVDDLLGGAMTVTLSPFVIIMRGAEYLSARFWGWVP